MTLKNPDKDRDYVSLMGIVAIFGGILNIYYIIPLLSIDASLRWLVLYNSVVYALFIVVGIIALITRNRECSTRVALCGILIGITFIFRNRYITEDVYSNIAFVVTLISFLLGILTVVSSIALLCGYPRYSTRLFQCMAVMTVLEAYPFWVLYHEYVPIADILTINMYLIPNMATYILMAVALRQESLRIPPVTEKIDDSLGTIKDMIYSDGETYITPEEAAELCRFIDSPEEGQRIEITLRSGDDARFMTIHRVNGRSLAEIVPKSGRNFMDGFRVEIRGVVRTDDMIRMFGGPGVFVQITVHPIPPKKDIKTKIRSGMKFAGNE